MITNEGPTDILQEEVITDYLSNHLAFVERGSYWSVTSMYLASTGE